ncbi:unnamed protein product [Rotaria sp. Silwood1]|nr:unnamed protein product [Rotaria sp. Silwood1]CAF0967778.1 unnamed protein product [Rotaria sp. Silwood1]CAF0977073.1 unnamed protein product [Rotaria sp. Silwood1]CAF3392432.1 unnamed protein product [Rotaria sp. Silwood1]CAF3409262.1 unnamed protein product [Rotaria sp. Silwood1]
MRTVTTTRRRRTRPVRRVRTSGGSCNVPQDIQNGHVSLANIATAFLSERKSSSRRQNSIRRKTRLTVKGQQISNVRRQSSYPTVTDEIKDQRLSSDNMDVGISTLFVPTSAITNGDNKHQSKMKFIVAI